MLVSSSEVFSQYPAPLYGGNGRSKNFLLLSDLFLREEGIPEVDINV